MPVLENVQCASMTSSTPGSSVFAGMTMAGAGLMSVSVTDVLNAAPSAVWNGGAGATQYWYRGLSPPR